MKEQPYRDVLVGCGCHVLGSPKPRHGGHGGFK